MINWRWPSLHCQPIGLDIGASSIKMIQLAVNGEHVRVIAADKVRIDPDANTDDQSRRSFIVSSVKRMMAENNFHGRNVVSNLSNDDVKITSLRLAEEHGDKIEQALRKEAGVRFGLEMGKDMIDYLVAGTVQQGDEIRNELIMFAAADHTIRDHIKMLEEASLRPVGIDAVPCALFRSSGRFLRRHEDREQTVVFIDIGSRFTTVVFGRGGEISFVKQIPMGAEKFNQQITSRLGIGAKDAEMLRGALRIERMNANVAAAAASSSNAAQVVNDEAGLLHESVQVFEDKSTVSVQREQSGTGLDTATRQTMIDAIIAVAEELAHEVSLCFRYYTVTFRGKRVERVIVTGGGAYEGALIETLKLQLNTEVETGQPLRGFDMSDVRFDGCRPDMLCEWAIAVGLSLKGYDPAPAIESDQTSGFGKRAFDSKGDYERN